MTRDTGSAVFGFIGVIKLSYGQFLDDFCLLSNVYEKRYYSLGQ